MAKKCGNIIQKVDNYFKRISLNLFFDKVTIRISNQFLAKCGIQRKMRIKEWITSNVKIKNFIEF